MLVKVARWWTSAGNQGRRPGGLPANNGFLVQNRLGVNRVNTLFYKYKHLIQADTAGEIQVIEITYNPQRLVDRLP
jgi:hypothetical protein